MLLYTLRDVSQHCSYQETINFFCHHCLTNFDNMGALAAHMNQKGAHLRKPLDFSTYTTSLLSPATCTTAVLPISQPASQPTPTLSGSLPTLTVAISDDVTLEQLLQDIDTPVPVQSVPDTDSSASSAGMPPFQPQAASTQQQSFAPPDVSPTVGARPKTTISYSPGEYRQLRQQNTEHQFLLLWCLHHFKSLPAPPPSAGGEFDLALRRVLRQTAITPPQFDENSSPEDIVSQLYDLHVGTVTKFP